VFVVSSLSFSRTFDGRDGNRLILWGREGLLGGHKAVQEALE